VTHSLPIPGIVQGVTRLFNELYVLLASDADQIRVYTTDCEHVRSISVAGLGSTGVCDIASCQQNSRLYLSNVDKNCIHVVVPKASSSKNSKWTLSENPFGLSVMRTGNLLVTCGVSRRLMEFNPRGKSIRTIILDSDICQPLHSVQLAGGDYVLCCCGGGTDGLHRVCIVDGDGKVKRSYGSTRGAGERQLSWPTHLAVDRDGFVFVADRDNARIVVLSPTLEFASLVLPNELQRRTNHVYVDDDDKLYASSRVFDERRSLVSAVQLCSTAEPTMRSRVKTHTDNARHAWTE